MPRIQTPWYKWRLSWKHLPWFVVAIVGVWAAVYLMTSGYGGGVLLLLVSLPMLWGTSKALWRNRQPFVLAIRGHRKVKFRGGGRDGIVLEEDGRRVNIFSELSGGKISRAIHASSIQKYEPPYESERLTLERREEILDLLCEEYDYRGVKYQVVMDSKLSVPMACPRCREGNEIEIKLPFGCVAERHYRIGDQVEWRKDRPPEQGGRRDHGNLSEEVGYWCPTCRRDSWLIVSVNTDRIDKVEVNSSRAPMIPDDSIPIIENGKITGHRIEPKKR